MLVHRAYGLGIASEIHLPALPLEDGEADVRIRFGAVDVVERPEPSPGRTSFRGAASDGILLLPDVACIRVRAGREVVVEPANDADQSAVRALLLGPALGVLLTQRGFTVLHASAVAFDGFAVAFTGEAGSGKSTIVAALHRRGRPLVADDVLAVSCDDGRPRVVPAFPQVKVMPEVVRLLGDDPDRLESAWSGTPKRVRRLDEGFASGRPLLGRVYVLDTGTIARISDLPASEAAVELLRHSYGVRALHGTAPASFLRQAATVAGSVPVLRLERPRELSLLADVVELVEQDVEATAR